MTTTITRIKMNPVSTIPRDGRMIMLFLNSGYTHTPYRVEVASYQPKYRPKQPWVNYANDSIFDAGGEITDFVGWLPVPVRHDDEGHLLEYDR